MDEEGWDAAWQALTQRVRADVQAWRRAHPRATLREIEATVEVQWAQARTHLVEETVQASAARTVPSAGAAERLPCPECGAALQGRGLQQRRLLTTHNQEVTLEREYAQCPACGAGLFPPRRGARADA
jgi:predicted RNA-binding Zn-ribbon protein involved in translation (DUF1610 family)